MKNSVLSPNRRCINLLKIHSVTIFFDTRILDTVWLTSLKERTPQDTFTFSLNSNQVLNFYHHKSLQYMFFAIIYLVLTQNGPENYIPITHTGMLKCSFSVKFCLRTKWIIPCLGNCTSTLYKSNTNKKLNLAKINFFIWSEYWEYTEQKDIQMELFLAKIVNSWKPLTIFAKGSMSDVWQCSK